jgi:hypothetical protein
MTFEERKELLFNKIIAIYEDAEIVVEEISKMPDLDKIAGFKAVKPLLDIVASSSDMVVSEYIPMLKNGSSSAYYDELERRIASTMSQISAIATSIDQNHFSK